MVTKPQPHPKLPTDSFGWFYPMGSGHITTDNPYGLTQRLPYVTDHFIDIYERHGAKVCVRHRPFGETAGGPMDWDQAATIKADDRWSWLIDEYHRETIKLLDRCPDAIVIDYLGTIEQQLEQRRQDGQYSQLLHRLWSGCQPCLNHRVWIGLDAACGPDYPDGSIYHHFMEMVAACKREQGCDVVVEALPVTKDVPNGLRKSAEWTQVQHALCLERFYQDRINKLPDHFRFSSDTATTFRVANGHSREAWDQADNPIGDWVQDCKANKHTPIWGMPGYDFDEFVTLWAEA